MKEYLYRALTDINKLEEEVTLFCYNYDSNKLVAIQKDSTIIYMNNLKVILGSKISGKKYFLLYENDIENLRKELINIQNNHERISINLTGKGIETRELKELIINGELVHKLSKPKNIKIIKNSILIFLLKLTSSYYRKLIYILNKSSE